MSAVLLRVFIPGGILAVALLWGLRRAGYSSPVAGLVMLLALFDAGFVIATMRPGHSLWLALAVVAVTASASAFAEREDARRVILLGGALGAIQIADPLGGLIAAGLLPAVVAMRQTPVGARKVAGLYTLLLFVPVMTAGLLFYASRAFHAMPIDLFGKPASIEGDAALGTRLLAAAAPVLSAAPAIRPAQVSRRGRATMLVAFAVLAASVFAAVTGTIRDMATLLAAGVPLSMGAIAALPEGPARAQRAVILAAICTMLSWLLLVLASG